MRRVPKVSQSRKRRNDAIVSYDRSKLPTRVLLRRSDSDRNETISFPRKKTRNSFREGRRRWTRSTTRMRSFCTRRRKSIWTFEMISERDRKRNVNACKRRSGSTRKKIGKRCERFFFLFFCIDSCAKEGRITIRKQDWFFFGLTTRAFGSRFPETFS